MGKLLIGLGIFLILIMMYSVENNTVAKQTYRAADTTVTYDEWIR